MLFVTSNETEDRMAICGLCEHYKHNTQSCGPLMKGKRVTHQGTKTRLCGCIMPLKSKLRVASCPLGKWSAQFTESELGQMREFLDKMPERLNGTQQAGLVRWFNKITGQQRKGIGCCSASARSLIKTMRQFVDESERQLAKAFPE